MRISRKEIQEISSSTLDQLDGKHFLSPFSFSSRSHAHLSRFVRFDDSAPEPREGLSSGHMPHSINLPSPNVLSKESSTTPAYKTMLPKEELVKIFVEAMGEENWELVKKGERRVVNTCGSGMTVRFLLLVSDWHLQTDVLIVSKAHRLRFSGWRCNERVLARTLRFTTRCVALDFRSVLPTHHSQVGETDHFLWVHRAGRDTLRGRRARLSRKSNKTTR